MKFYIIFLLSLFFHCSALFLIYKKNFSADYQVSFSAGQTLAISFAENNFNKKNNDKKQTIKIQKKTNNKKIAKKVNPNIEGNLTQKQQQEKQQKSSNSKSLNSNVGISYIQKENIKSNIPPIYPESCIDRKEQGLVILKLLLNDFGKITSLTVYQSSGHSLLDEAAIQSVAKWQFQQKNQQKNFLIPINFSLD